MGENYELLRAVWERLRAIEAEAYAAFLIFLVGFSVFLIICCLIVMSSITAMVWMWRYIFGA